MALTIDTQPGTTDPIAAYRPIIYEVSSNHADIVNIIADIYIDTVYLCTLTAQADASGDTFFDVQRIVAAKLAENLRNNNYNLPAIGAALVGNLTKTDYDVSLQLKFFEETEAADGTLTSNWAASGAGTADATSNTSIVLPATLQHDETQNLSAYRLNSGGSNSDKFLTNAPTSLDIDIGDDYYLFAYLDSTLGTGGSIQINKFDSNDSNLGGITQTLTVASDGVFCFSVGPANLNAHTASFIDSDVAYYIVDVNHDAGGGDVQVSESRTFNLIRDCDEPVRLHFFNHLGGWDAFTFQDGRDYNLAVEKEVMQLFVEGGFTTDTPDKEVLGVRAEKVFATQAINLTDAERDWLEELLTSIKVFNDIDGSRFSCTVIEDTYNIDDEEEEPAIRIAYRLFDLILQRN